MESPSTVLWVLGVLVAGYFLLRLFRRSQMKAPPQDAPFPPEERRAGTTAVVGESFNRDALRALFPITGDQANQRQLRTAMLHPQDDNPHDDQAVAVSFTGTHIGYLSRADARRYRAIFRKQSIQVVAEIRVPLKEDIDHSVTLQLAL